VYKRQEYGICHMQYSGGEPLSRMDALMELLSNRKEDVDYWVLTSGYGLTADKATQLKKKGLTGVVVSLDHWKESLHNKFRKNPKSFFWVGESVRNCRQAGLVTGLSICATRSFVSEENLWKYAGLARSWGIGFIQILEPGQVGYYVGQDVLLLDGHIQILEHFFLEMNSKRTFRKYPIVMYPGYHQRKMGCLGAGNRYVYIDSKGDIHACPFCQDPKGNLLQENLPDVITLLKEAGCHRFATNPVE
jgi:MoaA/NifB/PqqE/SkfB family radical SAM enzyme